MKVKESISLAQIKAIREALGNTQAEMADRMGVSLGGWQQWEYGTRPLQGPAFKLLMLLCPDELRANLFLDIEKTADKIGETKAKPEGIFREPLPLRTLKSKGKK